MHCKLHKVGKNNGYHQSQDEAAKIYLLAKSGIPQSLAKSLPEYAVVRAIGDVGEVLEAKLIAEIGDVRRLHHGKSLISYAGGEYLNVARLICEKLDMKLCKV